MVLPNALLSKDTLACGHNQHTRHNPPWTERPWVITVEGREAMLGHLLNCKKCDEGAPSDCLNELYAIDDDCGLDNKTISC